MLVQLAPQIPSLVLVDTDAEMQERLAYAIRAAMAAKGWKAPDLARALKRDASTTARWADGTSVPNLLMIKPLAKALGVKPEFLYSPPEIPAYPLSEYLVREATEEGLAEGIQRRIRNGHGAWGLQRTRLCPGTECLCRPPVEGGSLEPMFDMGKGQHARKGGTTVKLLTCLTLVLLAGCSSTAAPVVTAVPTVAEPTATPKPAAAVTFLELTGNGIKNSAPFLAPDVWTLAYAYDCKAFGLKGNFQVYLYDGESLVDVVVNELGVTGSGSTILYHGGSLHVQINSECGWSVAAKG